MDTRTLATEIRNRNPKMTLEEIARICGVSRQAVHQALSKPRFVPKHPAYEPSYESEAANVRRIIKERGRIWEGCRGAFESGEYHSENLARMLREGVIVPDVHPEGGYVLPS